MSNNHRILVGLGVLAAAPWLLGASVDNSPIEEQRTLISVTGTAEMTRPPSTIVLAAAVESDSSTASGASRCGSWRCSAGSTRR